MKIRAKLQLSTIAALIVGASVMLAILLTNNKVNRMVGESSAHGKLVQSVFALDQVLDDYLSHPDSLRVRHQWQKVYGSLGGLLKQLEKENESALSISPLLESYQRIDPLIKQLTASQSSETGAFKHARQREILTDQLSVNLTSMVTLASQALQLNQARIIEAQKRASNITAFLMIALVVANGMIFFLLARRLTRSVLELHDGTRTFGSGNLGHRIALRSNDEIGELGHAFNEMASRLSSSHTAMEAEMAERKRAEKALRELNESLEQRVAERTARLEEANMQLHAEISERRRTEEALRQSEERMNLAVQCAAMGTWDVDMRTGCAVWSHTHFEILGYPPNEDGEATPEMWRSRVHPDDMEYVTRALETAHSTGSIYAPEHRIIRADNGEVRWLSVFGRFLRNEAGEASRFVGIFFDNTERKQGEEALQQSQKTFAELIERAPFGIYVVDARFRIAHMNTSSQNGAFRNVRPVIGRDFAEAMRILWPEAVAAQIIGVFRHTLETGEPYYSPQFVNPRADVGVTESYEWELHRMTLPDGQYGVICYYYDSTKLREAEAAVRESEERLRSLAENVPCVLMRFDRQLRIAYLSPQSERYNAIPVERLIGRTNREVGMPEELCDLWDAATARVFSTGTQEEMEFDFAGPSGIRTFALKLAPEFGPDHEVRYVLGVSSDITERKQAEKALRASLREKEVLLNEIHHRVKNNMQVISSLVSLQADELENASMRSILEDVTHRVRSMALVHEKLYQSADLARVEFAEYTESLLGYLWRAHESAASRVRLALDLEPVSLPVDTAVPCGLILNELVINALKHAFHGRDGGEVSVVLRGDTDSTVRLCVRDDGTGLPEAFDWKKARSLGLHLVQMLSRQLRATVEVKSIGGTEFEIVFKGSKT